MIHGRVRVTRRSCKEKAHSPTTSRGHPRKIALSSNTGTPAHRHTGTPAHRRFGVSAAYGLAKQQIATDFQTAMTSVYSPRSNSSNRWPRRIGILVYLAFTVFVLWSTKNLGMMDNGDFTRSFAFMIDKPVGFSTNWPEQSDERGRRFFRFWIDEWEFKDKIGNPLGGGVPNTASLYVLGTGLVQKVLFNNYQLRFSSFLSKVALFVVLWALISTISAYLNLKAPIGVVLAALLVLVFALPSNLAFFNSFYQEQIVLLFLPLLLLGFLSSQRKLHYFLTGVSIFFLAGSKTQFFYLPALFLLIYLFASWVHRARIDWSLVLILLLAQAVSLGLTLRNSHTPENHYHALYYGAYGLMTPDEVANANIERKECIGVDAYKANDCYEGSDVHWSDVISVYARNPQLLVRAWFNAIPEHYVADSWHVRKWMLFIAPPLDLPDEDIRSSWLFAIGAAHQRLILDQFYWVLPILLLVVSFGPVYFKKYTNYQIALIFLCWLSVSQIFVSLLGDGTRDMSKHLAVSILSYDLTLVLLLVPLLQMIGIGILRFRQSP